MIGRLFGGKQKGEDSKRKGQQEKKIESVPSSHEEEYEEDEEGSEYAAESNVESDDDANWDSGNNRGSEGEEDDEDDGMVAEIFENQFYDKNLGRWSSALPSPNVPGTIGYKRFASSAGGSDTFPQAPLVEGWEYFGEWEVDFELDEICPQGWVYGASFPDIEMGLVTTPPAASKVPPNTALFRRKRWIRQVIPSKSPISKTSAESSAPVGLATTSISATVSSVESSMALPSVSDEETLQTPSPVLLSRSRRSVSGSQGSKSPKGSQRHRFQDFENDEPSSKIRPTGDTDSIVTDSTTDDPSGKSNRPSSKRLVFGTGAGQIPIPKSFFLIKDPQITAIGKQLALMDAMCKKDAEAAEQAWAKNEKPVLEGQIKEYERKCAAIQAQIDKELHLGLDHVSALEKELAANTELLESYKKRYYFPRSNIVMGGGGTYVGLDDIWVENASGHFMLDIMNNVDTPLIQLVLCGDEDSGMTIRLQVEGCKLAADKGKGVPKLKMDVINVIIELAVSVQLKFDFKKKKWVTSPQMFNVRIISCKGTYGSVISMAVGFLMPTIRSQIVNLLPAELGHFIKKLPTPFTVKGRFDFTGVKLAFLSNPFIKNVELQQRLAWSPSQMEMFMNLQKALERTSPLKNMADILTYRRQTMHHPRQRDTIIHLWEEACRLYTEHMLVKLANLAVSNGMPFPNPDEWLLVFSPLLSVADDVSRKKLVGMFVLRHFDAQISINELLGTVKHLLLRLAKDGDNSGELKQKKLEITLGQIEANYASCIKMVSVISNNLDFAQVKLGVSLHSGMDGMVLITLNDVLVQAPVFLNFSLSTGASIGYKFPVPIILSFKPQTTGQLFIEINHCDNIIQGNSSVEEILHNIIVLTVASPHLSMIVDKPITLKPGAEIFTLVLGPRDKDWHPFGSERRPTLVAGTTGDADASSNTRGSLKPTQQSGCPGLMQTGPGIKFLAEVANVDIAVNLTTFMRFARLNFDNMTELKIFLEKSVGADIIGDEHLEVAKMFFERFEKYLLSDGLDLEVNLDGKMVAIQDEIMILLQTPHDAQGNDGKSDDPRNSASTVKLKFEIHLMDLLGDALAIEAAVMKSVEVSQAKNLR